MMADRDDHSIMRFAFCFAVPMKLSRHDRRAGVNAKHLSVKGYLEECRKASYAWKDVDPQRSELEA